MLKKSTLREIRTSLARYLAIFAIVALGVGFFAGLKVCKASMLRTAQNYLNDRNMYHYELLSSYGADEHSVMQAQLTNHVLDAEGSTQIDAIFQISDTREEILKCISLPERVNTPGIIRGRLPENKDECAVDAYHLNGSGYKLGDTIALSGSNKEDTLESFTTRKFKIVGMVNSPLYLDYQRGSTDIGDGSIDTYLYVHPDAMDLDYYTSVYVTTDTEAPDFSGKQETELTEQEASMKKLAAAINTARREVAKEKAQKKLDKKIDEYEEGVDKYEKGLDEYNQGMEDYKNGKAELKQGKIDARENMKKAEKELDRGAEAIKENRPKLKANLKEAKATLAGLKENLANIQQGLKNMEAVGATGTEEYKALKSKETKVKAGIKKCRNGISQIESGLESLDAQEQKIAEGRITLKSNREKANTEFKNAKAELETAKKKLAAAKTRLADTRKKLDKAQDRLDEAQEKIDEMATGNSYAISREDNAGYSSYKSNSDIVSNIAKIFPVFFFLVAALVCMTTMTRMIDEQRTQIGVLKALGYSNRSILGKYMFYSGSASALGAICGFFVGTKVFPTVIWRAYTMMYSFSDRIEYVFDFKLLILSLAAAMLCSMGATWASIYGDFKVVPAELIRPKTPPSGKRILMERIPAVWNRISFLYKVSIRNIFRYKKRFVMMILGISGCTALLIAGFGINTTVSKVAEYQYSEISVYDYQVLFSENMKTADQEKFIKYMNKKTDNNPGEIKFLHQSSAEMSASSGRKIDVSCIASEADNFDRFVRLHNGSDIIPFPGNGKVVVARKVQKELGVKPGDTVTIKNGYREMKVTVSACCDNYVGENVFMSIETYRDGMKKSPAIKSALVRVPDGTSDADIREMSTQAGKYKKSAAVVVSLDLLERVARMMKSLNAVVYVVILCAGLLAFIVLYNLTNINIMERIREIATIKVLGFNQHEVSAYVFRENLFLSAIASVFGIPLGRWLLRFVIDNIAVSMIYFQPRINTVDYVYSVLMTLMFAMIVNLAMRRRLRNISMTESLKSIE